MFVNLYTTAEHEYPRQFLVITIGLQLQAGLCNKIVKLFVVFDVRVQAVDSLISGPVYYSLVKSQ